ncbi:MAG: hypothetical protein OXG92_12490 [Chloroflexi bacterium]|nr:hypothetical protein [Chloroflexota bacterium]MCY3582292.1 hypothetical protein [Chloroflexota bacterium]MCY3717272.1 hypothetical protein [Chloroflexota bacterium]MDE2651749.1 hypothetical protein [Chloroflexota bacterium]
MSDFDITQEEADYLLKMEKQRVDAAAIPFPLHGQQIVLQLQSLDLRENFLLDLSRGRRQELRVKLQTRARVVIRIARLDLGGRPHRNADGTVVQAPHLHLYREGFHDRWAIAPPSDKFSDLEDLQVTLDDFMRFCNIVQPPDIRIQKGLI